VVKKVGERATAAGKAVRRAGKRAADAGRKVRDRAVAARDTFTESASGIADSMTEVIATSAGVVVGMVESATSSSDQEAKSPVAEPAESHREHAGEHGMNDTEENHLEADEDDDEEESENHHDSPMGGPHD
jgi:TATA-binding protein-associated factor Taf7